jgi:hypothetical protein
VSKVFKAIGAVASIAAMIPGPWQPFAAAAAMAANIGAQLTAKKPVPQGQVQGVMIGANNPLPYLMGEAYTEGVEIYRVGYGGKVGKVQNPYAFVARLLSCCGPIQSMGTTLVDHESVTLTGSVGSVQPVASGGYYEDFLWLDQQLGARPEADALGTPAGWGTPPGWGSGYKLSGMAAVAWNMKWDKDGQVFGGGQVPPLGKVPQGVWAYDPRLDSTFPGGSGAQRITDESTWAYTRNPACHAVTYAYGRKVNGVPVFGGRMFAAASIDLADAVAWANTCDANGWTVNGTIFEPGDKWNNLKRICEAGGAMPVLRGGVLGFDFQAPRTSLYTVTRDDLAFDGVRGRLGKRWKDQVNTLVGRYRSPAHQWEYVQAAEVSDAGFLAADGEEKTDERQWDLVTDVDQLTELAIYDLWQRREAGPFVFVGKPHMRIFGPGDCLTLHEELGAHPDGEVVGVVRKRKIDAMTGAVAFVLEADSAAKHIAALGAPGTAPAVPATGATADVDEAWAVNARAPLDLENEYDATSGAITPYNTWVAVASRTGNAPAGGVVVQISAIVDVLDNCKYEARLLCDGVQVQDALGPITVNQNDQVPLNFAWAHSPGAGSHTWTIQVRVNNNGINVKNPLLQVYLKT